MTAPRELTNVRVESLSLDDQANAWGHPPPQVVTAPTTRTDGIDFAAILAHCRDAMHDAMEFPSYIDVDVLLAVEVPEACPDCKGLASPDAAPGMVLGSCAHPNATTIGQMLREHQALTALAEFAGHDDMCGASQAYGPITCDCGLDAARAALEAVRS